MSNDTLPPTESGQPAGQPAGQTTGRSTGEPVSPAPGRVRLPLARPVATYVFLALIAVVFLGDAVLQWFTGTPVFLYAGVQVNSWVAAGEYWRLLGAIFLHGSLTHLAINGWALFSLGREVEAFYTPRWFTAIYLISGLAGNIAWYLLGADGPSVGASGAIFGLIGAEVACFVLNRQLFGKFGRQRLGNLAVLVGINVVLGFTIPNINYYAHFGGLIAGFLFGLALSPQYKVTWSVEGFLSSRRLVDVRSQGVRYLMVLLALAVLFGLSLVGNQRWAG